MNKLMRKFMLRISLILLLVMLFSLYVNIHLIDRYYLHQQRRELHLISAEIKAGTESLAESTGRLETEHDVVIAVAERTADNDLLNEQLRRAFLEKGIGLKKYWLWDQDHRDALDGGQPVRLYQQEKLHYGLLMEYLVDGDYFIAVAKIIPAVQPTLNLVNRVTMVIFTVAFVALLLLIFLLVRQIIRPLNVISAASRNIAALQFDTIDVRTGDELEALAEDINRMSSSLAKAHRHLEVKNRQMKDLLANVSHDLKTPVALIKAYTSGIKDGIDDGTFLDTVIAQNSRMEEMIKQLLDLSRSELTTARTTAVSVGDRLADLLLPYRLELKSRNLDLVTDIQQTAPLCADAEVIDLILSNLISNAVKYARGGEILITLKNLENGCEFTIQNGIDNPDKLDPDRLWEPFYVVDPSRNKAVSGTGLGLAIVKSAAEQAGYPYGCRLKGQQLLFYVRFVKPM